jgi:hypothetical protein
MVGPFYYQASNQMVGHRPFNFQTRNRIMSPFPDRKLNGPTIYLISSPLIEWYDHSIIPKFNGSSNQMSGFRISTVYVLKIDFEFENHEFPEIFCCATFRTIITKLLKF